MIGMLCKKKFDSNQTVSSMEVCASLNNYDAVEDLGEDKIKEIAYEDFKNWALNADYNKEHNYSEEEVNKLFDKWFNTNFEFPEKDYISSLKENYGRVDYTTDFSIYVDENVKVFSKDLKEYDGISLQYIGIMPIKEDLDKYITNITHTDILDLINNLKELKRENFKDGYLTYIHGYIPKFSFEYVLDLKDDLSKMNITDVFEQGKANLTNLTDDENAYISFAKHKANIEFTQDGIKTADATNELPTNGGGPYDCLIEMPTENIDITFDKPYIFFIRDKNNGETWFVGTVYNPLDINDEQDEYKTAYEEIVLEEEKNTPVKEFTDDEVKNVFQKNLDLVSAKSNNLRYALFTLGLYADEDFFSNYDNEEPASKELFIKTPVKFKDFKNEMLKYMTKEFYRENWADLFYSEDGYLCYKDTGATGVSYTVNSIKKINDDNTYSADVTAQSVGPDTKLKIKFKINANKCVIESYEFE